MSGSSSQTYRFDEYVVDLDRACLLRDGRPVDLRPQAFDTLRYLVEHRGRLTTKAELMQALWPKTIVTDSSLVKCIQEVRNALRDERHRYVQTVPRRGYIFDAAVVMAGATIDAPAASSSIGSRQSASLSGGPSTAAAPPTRASGNLAAIGFIGLALGVLVVGVFLIDEESRRSARPPGALTIAVLPFEAQGPNEDAAFFADGIHSELLTQLAKIGSLGVISRTSVLEYRDGPKNVREISRELGVASVLEGGVQRAGSSLRVNVQLIDAATDEHMWAETYTRDLSAENLFAIQAEMATSIAAALQAVLTPQEVARLKTAQTSNLAAYEAYLRAEQARYGADVSSYADTVALYEQAIALDPDFSAAHAGLAKALVEIWRRDYHEILPSAVARRRAREAAARALVLDPDSARAYSVLALLQVVEGRHETAIESAEKAVAVAPSDAEALMQLGLVLAFAGRASEARAAVESALRLNPRPTPEDLLVAGIGFFASRQYEQAAEAIGRARDARPTDDTARVYLASTYAHLDWIDEAHAEIEALLELLPIANLEYYRVRDAYYERPEDLAVFIEGLRKAGLPEWPYDYRGNAADRLDRAAAEALIAGRTWVGRHVEGTQFVQELTTGGRIAYRAERSLLSGTVDLRGDRLCRSFEGYLLDRALCGYLYRNAAGTRDDNNEYVSVMPDSLTYFSVVP